ncbi:phosphomannomutase [Aureococcus anophagefferens]|nr:phosphomannomutase [Aureococcus anophagefferens]
MAAMAPRCGKITVGVVGGSDFPKQKEQLGEDVTSQFDYAFSENGLMAFKGETLIGQESFARRSAGRAQKLINWVLAYLSKVTLPVKRGTFIEFRTGMLNISPVGRNCSALR